jgi:hypothetical protein
MTDQETAAHAYGRRIVEDWLSFHPEVEVGGTSSELIGTFLKEKNWELSHANLERAYLALKAQGHFTTAPAESPLPPVHQSLEHIKCKKDVGRISPEKMREYRKSFHWESLKVRIDEILRRGK